MSKLNIFVSSTCFDLKALREHLREGIQRLGHVATLSEHSGFPVNPTADNLSNCRKAIEQHADILVLVIGGRYGSINEESGKSITNLEYIEAKRKGIDRFIFVEASVLNLLEVYRDNPSGNYKRFVDSTKVFDFIDDIKKENRWIFKFDRTEEIITSLTEQLSFRFQDLLVKSRENRLTIPKEFQLESEEVIEILFSRPPNWEYKLTALALANRLDRLNERFRDLDRGVSLHRLRNLKAADCSYHISSLIADLQRFLSVMMTVLTEEIVKGWGEDGKDGDPHLILKGCESLYNIGLGLYGWEVDIRFITPPEEFRPVFELMRDWPREMINQMNNLCGELRRMLAGPGGEHRINLTFKAPKSMDEFSILMDQLGRNADLQLKIMQGL